MIHDNHNRSLLLFVPFSFLVVASMKEVSLIINARWVVPVIPENTVYEYYSVVIDGSTIVDCLPTAVHLVFCVDFRRLLQSTQRSKLWTSWTMWSCPV